ncbi:MAG: L-aspartate oxidase [Kiritimatiellae bacterium]|jgi:L-aspartate oxidase|nr:L-aspartate oxidase [Kiritimatiellia bacterium]
MRTINCDYLVVGSGLAGTMAAIGLAAHGRVLMVTKRSLDECNTNYAQGGISCVMGTDDSFDLHVADTLDAGAGLCNEAVVRRIVEAGPQWMRSLIDMGVPFSKSDETACPEGFDLTREGGHTRRRILHAGDITGREVERTLVAKVKATKRLHVCENTLLIDLVTTRFLHAPTEENRVVGAYLLSTETGEIWAVRTGAVILATGGCGKVYQYTCNPDIATGDGVAVAWRAGAEIRNMEMVQFHPTCLYHPKAKRFLISEAVRGEGAELVTRDGEPFMQKYDPRGSLAPRDIVARAIDSEMKKRGDAYCCLDIRHKGEAYLKERFPGIYAKCLEFGIDMAKDLIPIVPAAHYCCGGIAADVTGKTTLPGLYAIGECACTGLHGANRLASNSLLEAMVCGCECAKALCEAPVPSVEHITIPDWVYGHAVPTDEAVLVAHNWQELRTCMWDYVGIVRTNKRLHRAMRRVRNLREEINSYYFDYLVTADILELRNIADVAEMIITSAMERHESRGLHYSLDYPERLRIGKDTKIVRAPEKEW